MKWAQKQTGFTIVELLIVIVVIAILAAITIVSYNGIRQNAQRSASQAAARQVYSKVHASFIQTGEQSYPADLAAAGIRDGGSTYQYSVNNSSSPQTFCATATTGTSSYYVSNTQSSPQAGGCPGHGQNGRPVITNLATNPGFEVNPMDPAGANTGTRTLSTSVFQSGTKSTRFQWTSSNAGMQVSALTVKPSTTYSVSMYLYPESGVIPTYIISAGDYGTNPRNLIPANSYNAWQKLSAQYTTNAGQTTLMIWNTVGAASTYYVDSIMVAESATEQPYADGNTTNWLWSGANGLSSSYGPALP